MRNTNKTKTSKVVSAVIVALLILFADAGYLFAGDAASKPVVSVNGRVLDERNVQEYIQKVFPAMMFHKITDPERLEEYREQAIDLMVEEELMFQRARELGITVDKNQLEEEENKVIKRFGDKEKYRTALNKSGFTEEGYRQKLERDILIKMFIKKEIDDKAVVTDTEVRQYYDNNRKTFMRPEARKILHILIKVDPSATQEQWDERRQYAEEVRQKIVDGEDFGEIAWNYSEDDYRVKSGDLGLVHKGMLDPALQKAVWDLKEGELSGLIRTIYGYHIVRVYKVVPSTELGYERVKNNVKNKLTDRNRKELHEKLVSELKENAKIEKFD